jgi:hypothetical protein
MRSAMRALFQSAAAFRATKVDLTNHPKTMSTKRKFEQWRGGVLVTTAQARNRPDV